MLGVVVQFDVSAVIICPNGSENLDIQLPGKPKQLRWAVAMRIVKRALYDN